MWGCVIFICLKHHSYHQNDGTNARELQDRSKGGSLGRFKLFFQQSYSVSNNNHLLFHRHFVIPSCSLGRFSVKFFFQTIILYHHLSLHHTCTYYRRHEHHQHRPHHHHRLHQHSHCHSQYRKSRFMSSLRLFS